MFVDSLAEQFVGWTPYHYVHQNPINLIDPTGMSADGWIESYTEDGQTMLTYDADVDTKEQAVAKGYKNVRGVSESMYYDDGNKSYDLNKDGTVYDINTGAIIDVGFDPIRTAEGYFISENNQMKSVLSGMQDLGDAISAGGYALTLTGLGAKVGVPLAALGNTISTVGSGIEIGYKIFNGNTKNPKKRLAFMIGGELLNFGLNRAIPGPKKDLGREIIKQGAGLKLKILENEIIEVGNHTQIKK